MFLTLIRKTPCAISFLAGMALLLSGCQKKLSVYAETAPESQYELSSKINTSIPDFVTDEDNGPVKNAGLINYFFPVSGSNNTGSSIACDSSNQEFVNYSVNGAAISIDPTTGGTVIHSTDIMYLHSVLTEATSGPNGADLYFRFSDQNISVGSSQALYHIMNGVIGFPLMPAIPIPVHITEYGSVGQFISGNFTGTVLNFNPPNTSYVITCNFRVKRQF